MSALPAIPPPPLQGRPPRQIPASSPSSTQFPAPSTPAASALANRAPAPAPQPEPTPVPAPAHDDPLADSLLAAVAAGNQSLTQIAAAHNIPFPQFSLWLLKPETQQQLTQLSRAVASATRLTATAALPEVVGFLKKTLAEAAAPDPLLRETLFPTRHDERELPTPAQVFKLRRQRIGLSASYLLLRLARLPDPASAGAPAPAPAPQRTREHAPQPTTPSAPLPSFAPRFNFPPREVMHERKETPPLALTTARAAVRSDSLPRASREDAPPSKPTPPAIKELRDCTEPRAAHIRDHPCNPRPAFPAASRQRSPMQNVRVDRGDPLSMLSRVGQAPAAAAANPRSPPPIPSG